MVHVLTNSQFDLGVSDSELTLPSVKELMTIPNADKDLLIFFASSNV
jgi:hypothetical protein